MGIALTPLNPALGMLLFSAGQGVGLAQAIQAGQMGAWAIGFGASLAMGAFMPMPKADGLWAGLTMGAVRGAAIGAIAGGLSSALTGGNFGQGALYGALGGAAGGALSGFFSSQHYQNWAQGKGLTLDAELQRAAESARAARDPQGSIDEARAEKGAEGALEASQKMGEANQQAPLIAQGSTVPIDNSVPNTPTAALVVTPPAGNPPPRPGTREFFESQQYKRARFIIEEAYKKARDHRQTPWDPPDKPREMKTLKDIFYYHWVTGQFPP